MSLHPQYARPRSAAQAVELLRGLGSGAVVIAGGQELMPHINYGRLMPSVLVDISALPDLMGIQDVDGVLSIGALTVLRELKKNSLVKTSLPLLSRAASLVGGGWQVHNRGTLGGNIVAMHPLYDIIPPLLVLDAEVEILSAGEVRRAPLAAVISETSLGLGQRALITRIFLRATPPGFGWAYEKLKITEGAYGSANAAAVVAMHGGKVSAARLVIGAVSERPIDGGAAVESLLGRSFDDHIAQEFEAACAALVTQPMNDQQGNSRWRRAMAGVIARRAISVAVSRASAQQI